MPGTGVGSMLGSQLLDKPLEASLEMSAASLKAGAGSWNAAAPSSGVVHTKDAQAVPYSSSHSAPASIPPTLGDSNGMAVHSGMSVRLPPAAVRLLADVWAELGKVEGLLAVARHEKFAGRVGPVR